MAMLRDEKHIEQRSPRSFVEVLSVFAERDGVGEQGAWGGWSRERERFEGDSLRRPQLKHGSDRERGKGKERERENSAANR